MSRTQKHLLCAGLTLAVALATAQAQKPEDRQNPQKPQPFRTEANLVRVDVIANRNGTHVMDLKRDDFQVFEDGVPQTISTFELVDASVRTPAAPSAEPNSVAESREAIRRRRARVFVLFLDVAHVTTDAGMHAREPLIRFIDQLLGPDDLIGLMTPRMAASDVVFSTKTEMLSEQLRSRWPWGEQHGINRDDREILYEKCYPYTLDVVGEMTARKREAETLDALRELVTWLGGEREERKAILTVSEGWVLYRPNPHLTTLRRDHRTGFVEDPPQPDPIRVGPGGRITTGRGDPNDPVPKSICDADRIRLADVDHDRALLDVIHAANRANASFYTIDPRGLPVYDTQASSRFQRGLADARLLASRQSRLRELSGATDGFAVLNSNDFDTGLRRISDDLTSYYLLGYYSTNTKLDGRFRQLKVTVKRQGVAIRARRGYRAPTAAEVDAARAAASAPSPASTSAVREALSRLATAIAATDESTPRSDTPRVDAAGDLPHPLMFRRGQSTGNRWEPSTRPQFSRTERVRFEVGLNGDATMTGARVLDRNGAATPIPVTVTDRVDPSGQKWGVADLTLAALAAGDYIIEISGIASGTERKVLAAFRVTR